MSVQSILKCLRGLLSTGALPAPVQLRIVNLTRQSEVAWRGNKASDTATRRKGLLGRTGMEPGEAMWIVPCEAIHTFGMKFAIDVVYLDRQLRVVKTRCAVPRSRISACPRAHSVLELPAGTIALSKSQPGDQISIESICEPAIKCAAQGLFASLATPS